MNWINIVKLVHTGAPLRGNCTRNQKLACFVLYLKIINTVLENNVCIL